MCVGRDNTPTAVLDGRPLPEETSVLSVSFTIRSSTVLLQRLDLHYTGCTNTSHWHWVLRTSTSTSTFTTLNHNHVYHHHLKPLPAPTPPPSQPQTTITSNLYHLHNLKPQPPPPQTFTTSTSNLHHTRCFCDTILGHAVRSVYWTPAWIHSVKLKAYCDDVFSSRSE